MASVHARDAMEPDQKMTDIVLNRPSGGSCNDQDEGERQRW